MKLHILVFIKTNFRYHIFKGNTVITKQTKLKLFQRIVLSSDIQSRTFSICTIYYTMLGSYQLLSNKFIDKIETNEVHNCSLLVQSINFI